MLIFFLRSDSALIKTIARDARAARKGISLAAMTYGLEISRGRPIGTRACS